MITGRATGPTRSAAVRGALAGAGIVPAILPMGVALGVAVGETAAPPVLAWSTAPLLTAGSAQLVLLTNLDAGASVAAAVLAATLVNARFVVYGAALAPRFAGQPGWFRWLGAWCVVDQTYAVVASAEASGRLDRAGPAVEFRHFYLTMVALLWLVWSLSVGVGVALGPVLPPGLPLEFVLPAMFVALVVPGLRTRTEVTTAVLGATVAVVLPSSTSALAVGAAIGLAVGATRRGGGDR